MSESKVVILRDENETSSPKKSKKKTNKKANPVLRVLAVVGVTLGMLLLTVFLVLAVICKGPSKSASQLFVTTILETGKLKFMASIYLTPEEIQEYVSGTSMDPVDTTVDVSLIKIPDKSSISTGGSVDSSSGGSNNAADIEVINIAGRTFAATLMIVKDPTRVSIATVYDPATKSWPKEGKNLDVYAAETGAVAVINAGLYQQWQEGAARNWGGVPFGVVVSNGEIQYNHPTQLNGLYMVGFNKDNILVIKNLSGMTSAQFTKYVEEEGIRDATTFQEEASVDNNHFVSLVTNGEPRTLNGAGSGLNPRTAIGQRADGAVLFLVTDGRGLNNHLGASASDLISIMMEYGAVNAANLDGGSSSSLYYNNTWLKTSVTFKYANGSWYLPDVFIVK